MDFAFINNSTVDKYADSHDLYIQFLAAKKL